MLVVAEMMGVKAGLGWYFSWAQGWAAYPNMYAALIVMALMCSGVIRCCFGFAIGCWLGRRACCDGSNRPRGTGRGYPTDPSFELRRTKLTVLDGIDLSVGLVGSSRF